jgi:hypothetical protein
MHDDPIDGDELQLRGAVEEHLCVGPHPLAGRLFARGGREAFAEGVSGSVRETDRAKCTSASAVAGATIARKDAAASLGQNSMTSAK